MLFWSGGARLKGMRAHLVLDQGQVGVNKAQLLIVIHLPMIV